MPKADTNSIGEFTRYRGVPSLSDPLPADIPSLNRCYFALQAASEAMLAISNQPRSKGRSGALVEEWRNALLIRKDEAVRAIQELRAESEGDLGEQWEVILDHMASVEPDHEGLAAIALHFQAERQRLKGVAVHA